MRQTARFSGAAALMARFTVRPVPNCWRNADRWGAVDTGDAKITRGYGLPARFVIHTVGPVWRDGRRGEAELLAGCYRNSLRIAAEKGLRTIAFPSISTGIYGYPIEEAAKVAVETVNAVISQMTDPPEVIFCCFSRRDLMVYERLLQHRAQQNSESR